jgi:hypothetical protein
LGKPKYTIGDAFEVTRSVTHDGCKFTGTFNYYVLSMTVESDDRGYCYKYGLGVTFPQAYVTASVSLWNYESVLDTLTKAEGYFGQA